MVVVVDMATEQEVEGVSSLYGDTTTEETSMLWSGAVEQDVRQEFNKLEIDVSLSRKQAASTDVQQGCSTHATIQCERVVHMHVHNRDIVEKL